MQKKNQKFFISLVIFMISLIAFQQWFLHHDKKIGHASNASRRQLSVVAFEHAKKTKEHGMSPVMPGATSQSLSVSASPLDRPSGNELREFPGAHVVDAIEVPGPDANQKTRVRILETNFKYPFIRTEEVIDQRSGAVVSREEMVADHLLVKLAEGQDPQLFLMSFGSEATSIVPVTPNGNVYQLQLKSSSLEALPQALDKIIIINGAVTTSEPDFIGHALLLPDDPGVYLRPKQSENFQWAIYAINAPGGWDIQHSASGIIVAVLDTGVRYTHEDLAANMWQNPATTNNDLYGCNVIDGTGDPNDDNGHGTHCAGIIGAVGNNDVGIAGIAWNIQLMACKWLDKNGSGTESGVVYCMDYACTHGANIINGSWGSFGYSELLYEAIQEAQQRGIIFVAAAGNSSADNGDPNNDSIYPAAFQLDNIVAVAATTADDMLADFSNYGTNVAIAAPGVNIYSTYNTSDSAYVCKQGTSMAAPHVTGTLALMMTQFPNMSYTDLIAKLTNSTDQIPGLVGKVASGRLNIAKALAP